MKRLKHMDIQRMNIRTGQAHVLADILNKLGGKKYRVCAYIINCIPEESNCYYINEAALSRALNCSKQLVINAVKCLRKDEFISIKGHYASLNLSKIAIPKLSEAEKDTL